MNHETLGSALNAGMAELVARPAVLCTESEQTAREKYTFGGMVYGETKSADVKLISYKNKPTKKWGHITIYRHESGRYEVNTYVL